MKIVVFAGGVGSRLWPLSRQNSPKQFGKIVDDKSTLQKTIDRLLPEFKPEDIYIATGGKYKDIVMEQLDFIPKENFVFEPTMRDVGPAIGLASVLLDSRFQDEPIAILWSDHLVKQEEEFRNILRLAEKRINEQKADFIFIAQKPRFANANIGWINIGEKVEEKEGRASVYKFEKLVYGPSQEQANEFFASQNYVWNLGYFVTTPKFLASLYKRFVPEMYDQLQSIATAWGTDAFDAKLEEIYPTLEKISFDNAILEKMSPDNFYVISEDMGWSDIGAWDAMKEALSASEDDNYLKGKVMVEGTRDSIIYNGTGQLVVGLDLDGMVVVTIDDVILICPKGSVPKIKKFVSGLKGTPNENLA
jgi:mannose-1-phosphate guanylyltransferase